VSSFSLPYFSWVLQEWGKENCSANTTTTTTLLAATDTLSF